MNRRFDGKIEQLRSGSRVKLLEVERVVELSLEKIFVTKALDVGCGSGLFSESFSLRKINVIGIDTNPDMIKAASSYVPSAKFQEAVAEKLPFEEKSFDLVFLGHVLHESDDQLLALKEARRVAASRVVVLEWPYKVEEIGPPIDHRIKAEKIKRLSAQAGLKKFEKISLTNMVLYRFDVD
jgi:ubiquinone/menaquinone biosynthesis C-methylase UbiE